MLRGGNITVAGARHYSQPQGCIGHAGGDSL